MSHTREEKIEAFGRFIDILDILREKCPWDHKQTNESLRPNTIEETYELCDALIRKDNEATKKELGDVLLHIAFYAKIGEEKGGADMKKTATISAILAVVGFMAVYVALCYLVPGWRLKLHATAWVYFTASLRHMALLKGVFAMAAGLVLATLPFLGMLREPLPEE